MSEAEPLFVNLKKKDVEGIDEKTTQRFYDMAMSYYNDALHFYKDGNYINKIFYEFETEKAVKFGRNIDEKILWIPKSLIKGGWKKDKKRAQNVKVKYPARLYWKESKKIYLEM